MHQYSMVENLNSLNPIYQEHLKSIAGGLSQYTHPVSAEYMAENMLYNQLIQQSTLLGFVDTFRMFSIAAMIIIPTVFLLKNIDYKKEKQ